jgi:hypothetical protein
MKRTLTAGIMICFLVTQLGIAQKNEPPSEEQIKNWPFEMRAQYFAGRFLDELPNFVVTEKMQRMERAPGQTAWKATDQLEIELTYTPAKGDRSKLLRRNGKPASTEYEKVEGATSMGEFGEIMALLFKAQFGKPRPEKFRDRRTMVFDFTIPRQTANYLLTEKGSGRKTTTGLEGTVWIDAETARILRIEYSATNIPPEFPLSMAEHAIEYDEVNVNKKKYFLPVSSEFIVGSDATKIYQRNLIEFRNYRIFETDVKVLIEEGSPKKKP